MGGYEDRLPGTVGRDASFRCHRDHCRVQAEPVDSPSEGGSVRALQTGLHPDLLTPVEVQFRLGFHHHGFGEWLRSLGYPVDFPEVEGRLSRHGVDAPGGEV